MAPVAGPGLGRLLPRSRVLRHMGRSRGTGRQSYGHLMNSIQSRQERTEVEAQKMCLTRIQKGHQGPVWTQKLWEQKGQGKVLWEVAISIMQLSGQLVLTYRAEQRLNITSIPMAKGKEKGQMG